MKSKKLFLGAVLMSLAIGLTSFNLFAEGNDDEIIGWKIKKDDRGYYCSTSTEPDYPTFDECMAAMSGGNY